MNINIKLDKNFTVVFNKLKQEYGQPLLKLNGFSESQLNFGDFIDNFVQKNNTANASIDSNANVNVKDVTSLLNEMNKPHMKLLSYNKIFYEINKKYGFQIAKQWLESEWLGKFYLHDSHSSSFLSYCFSYDLTDLATKGMFFINNFNAQPPKHLTTYTDFVTEYISWVSNRTSGGCSIPNFLIWSYYFWKKDCEIGYYIKSPEYYRDQQFQRHIYKLNQPFLRITQCAYVTMTIMDRNYLVQLFGGMEYPDGTFVIDYIDQIIEYQKSFVKVMHEIRRQNMSTFPVCTYSLLYDYDKDKFVDEDFARWCSDENSYWMDFNFSVDDNVTALSSCPLSGNTKIIYWSQRFKKFISSKIKDVYYNYIRDQKNFITVISKGKKIKCKINKFNIPANYKITLMNEAVIQTTYNHLNKVFGKDYVESKDLTLQDYLPIYKKSFVDTNNMSYEDGKLVGMFLGDGCYCEENSIVYSLNKETDEDDIEFLKSYCTKRYNAIINTYDCVSRISGNILCVNVKLKSKALRGLIQQFVVGNNALNKSVSLQTISCSEQFRKGIIDGLYTTDGGNNNRIYTSSEEMKDSLISLFASLGIATKVTIDTRQERLSDNPCYTIRWYNCDCKKSFKDVYRIDDQFIWFKIKNIEIVNKKENSVSFCLQVIDNKVEPIFMLANGIHTHNCRLRNDTKDIAQGKFSSIGGSALQIGSVKVNTINLARIAYQVQGKDEQAYLKILEERCELCCKVLDVVRDIIKRNVEKGLLPNYTLGMINIHKQFSTIGICALFQTIKKFGYFEYDELGYFKYTDKGLDFAKRIFDVVSKIKEKYSELTGYRYNVQQIPGERACAIFCQKDRLFFPNQNIMQSLYSNQWIALSQKTTIQERIRVGELLDTYLGGGVILHQNLDAPFNNNETAWNMLNYIAKHRIPYFAFNGKQNSCKNNHGFYQDKCPICGGDVETQWTRIVGYTVPVKAMSKERTEQYHKRQWNNPLDFNQYFE